MHGSEWKKVILSIWDTPGSEEGLYHTFTAFCELQNAVIFVYSIDKSQSFQDVGDYIGLVEKRCAPNTLKVLCGTKCDREENREVLKEDREDFATENDFFKCYETSAIEGYEHTISQMFEEIVAECVQRKYGDRKQ